MFSGAVARSGSTGKRFKQDLSQEQRLCVLWAEEDLAFRLIDRPRFRTCFQPSIPVGFNRHGLSDGVKAFAEEMTGDVARRLKNKIVTLAWDGWTDCRSEKNVNTILLHGGKAYFIRSHEVNHNDTDTLETVFEGDCKDVRDTIGAFVLAGVCDNAHAYQNALERVVAKGLIFIQV
jgi:hypothetical protein